MLEACDLAAIRGDRKLFDSVSFSLRDGDLLYVNGANGSGKTTLLRMLCGLVAPAAGEVRWRGAPIRSSREKFYAELLYLGHAAAIKDELNGLENLAVAARLSGRRLPEARLRAALQRMGLDGCEDLPSKVLSQGQRRRVSLARLLVTEARLWILDEPFTALDVGAVQEVQAIVNGHLEGGGIAVLTTHQPAAIGAAAVKEIRMGR